MKNSRLTSTILILVMVLAFTSNLLAADTAIQGVVEDAQTGEPLFGANLLLMGTSFGAATDLDGKFFIRNIPAGTYTIRVSYIGYEEQMLEITVKENQQIKNDFSLFPVSIEGEEVVITAQASGQNAAINQQLTSDKIINVVSAARIQEVPDANAAESVGRLPGVSLLRSGGEGDRVVVRGLEPKFNSITINGVKLSSSDSDNRSSDLSMISSNMLEGIQLSKTITADMDANVLGGVVNFELREAKTKVPGTPDYNFVSQGSANGLENAQNRLHNYKFVGTAENRFLDNRLGVLVQASYERRNLSSNELNASYVQNGNSETEYLTENITLDDVYRKRQRGNAVITIDYDLTESASIKLANLFSTSETESERRQQFYDVDRGNNRQNYNTLFSNSTLNTISNMLKYEQQFEGFNVKASLSHSYSETKNPNDWEIDFTTGQAGFAEFGFVANLNPKDIVDAATNDTTRTLLQTISSNFNFTKERSLTADLDLEFPLNFSNEITTVIKIGGKYQHQTRSSDINVIDGQNFGLASGVPIIDQLQEQFPWFYHRDGDPANVPISPFMDHSFEYGKFLGGEYDLVNPLNFNRMHDVVNFLNSNQLPSNVTYNYNVGSSIRDDYRGKEDIAAAYLMATINLGSSLKVIPGIRYQTLKTEYTASQGIEGLTSFADYPHEEKTVTSDHPYWLPSLLINYQPFEWADVRLAYTNTLSYPDYNSMTPNINVALIRNVVRYNGFELKPIRSTNYDLYLSFHSNVIGLFTIGGFYKEIKDVIYEYTFFPATGNELVDYYPDWVEDPRGQAGVSVSRYLNNPYKVENYGIELDWQTHFWYLPKPLTGLVLNVNYTHIFSEAEYPIQLARREGRRTVYTDTSYVAPLLYQPDDIVNITVGYDYKDFSIRISTLFSSKIFTGPSLWPQLRAYTDDYNRWDISIRQKLPLVEGLEIFANLNNINSADDVQVISAETGVPSQRQSYGYMMEFGLRGTF